MYISKISLRRGLSPSNITDLTRKNGYQTHQLIWNLFADNPGRPRDFIYRHEEINGWPTFYTVSKREPADTVGMWEILSKEYNPQLKSGQRLGFTLCANPIRSRHDENGRQQRHDVVMEKKLKLKKEGMSFNIPDIIQQTGFHWLEERAVSHGFRILENEVRADGYRQHRLFKGKENKTITFSSLDFNGILTVIEPDIFVKKCLFEGIGPAKAFGCGLMMVRRV
ncbi:MAG TPA: type I-E CRISPR-associated protein Cas6/Cse3/CasE [Desulfomonilia bacterium]